MPEEKKTIHQDFHNEKIQKMKMFDDLRNLHINLIKNILPKYTVHVKTSLNDEKNKLYLLQLDKDKKPVSTFDYDENLDECKANIGNYIIYFNKKHPYISVLVPSGELKIFKKKNTFKSIIACYTDFLSATENDNFKLNDTLYEEFDINRFDSPKFLQHLEEEKFTGKIRFFNHCFLFGKEVDPEKNPLGIKLYNLHKECASNGWHFKQIKNNVFYISFKGYNNAEIRSGSLGNSHIDNGEMFVKINSDGQYKIFVGDRMYQGEDSIVQKMLKKHNISSSEVEGFVFCNDTAARFGSLEKKVYADMNLKQTQEELNITTNSVVIPVSYYTTSSLVSWNDYATALTTPSYYKFSTENSKFNFVTPDENKSEAKIEQKNELKSNFFEATSRVAVRQTVKIIAKTLAKISSGMINFSSNKKKITYEKDFVLWMQTPTGLAILAMFLGSSSPVLKTHLPEKYHNYLDFFAKECRIESISYFETEFIDYLVKSLSKVDFSKILNKENSIEENIRVDSQLETISSITKLEEIVEELENEEFESENILSKQQ